MMKKLFISIIFVLVLLSVANADIQEKQRWVMENIYVGTKWDLSDMVERFGNFEKYDPDRFNPKIIQMFYFEDIDMTFMVNLLKGTISTWRLGRAYH